ncbi:D-amino acid dehydrogenase [Janthinobacterium sp.]|uniref:D-amino acid dehydrogenase n=1 Tax=Janthinobacterium sp. TaxID=1871054 RepID=UPI0025BDD05C|nr:D-amino acid dehydrogenase [Janthinobacterium sp.]NBV19155.1 D-amino acid dehydrogenase [Janthinobacterium sp.]
MKRVAVLGGGITGVTTAYALAKRGVDVTLVERHRYAAMETSYANGGQLSASHAEVWNHKATIVNALKWMARRDAPLLLHPWPSWHKLSWFAEFLAAMPDYERNTIATARMAIAAREHLFAWAQAENIAFDHRRAGILHVYRERAGFERAARVSRLLAQGGLQRRAVTPAEMRVIEPALQGDFYGGYYTDSDSTGDIHKFTSGLADACARLGVACRYGQEVTALEREHGKVRVGMGADSTLFDAVVVCAGTASRAMAASLGDHVNVYPVKGYSITVQLDDAASRAAAPSVSLLDDATKLVSSRLGEDRLRVAGTAEFNGIDYDIRADRIRPLVRWVEQCFPDIKTRQVIPWAGLRPMLPAMLPKVGPGKAPGVYYNTGHGHLGWTLAVATAELVAQQVAAVAQD